MSNVDVVLTENIELNTVKSHIFKNISILLKKFPIPLADFQSDT
jgi:hypothetical protein